MAKKKMVFFIIFLRKNMTFLSSRSSKSSSNLLNFVLIRLNKKITEFKLHDQND